MTLYQAPVRDTEFLLNNVLGLERYGNLPGFADATPDLLHAVLAEAARFAAEVVQPLNAVGDREGCTLADGEVTTPTGFRDAYAQLVAGGWVGLTARPEDGGQGLPEVFGAAFNEYMSSASMAFAMYPGLSMGAYALLARHASPELQAIYLPKLASGAWTGTMNLTEPQCGTDLGLLRTRATPAGDGSYRISGTKIFISAGEHDLAENIVHLVLARIDGAPEGTKGISLFIVPKFLPDDDGLGARNALRCTRLETKMGIHGNATCEMVYDEATGFLVGEEHKGLRAMFTMMNGARLGVGVQGLALSEVAYQNAAAYARERRQGRALTGPAEPDEPADLLIVHPDVRRILLDIRAFNEAARALVLWVALKGSVAAGAPDEAAARTADDQLGLLTPIVKGVLTDIGFANAVAAQQILGGHGYIADNGMEQFVRDARIAMLYEGANAIQALDLVGRKLPKDGGRALMAFFAELDRFLGGTGEGPAAEFASALKAARDDLEAATVWLMNNAMAKPDNAGAAATDYMHLFGLVALGLMWGRIAVAANSGLEAGADDPDFLEQKLVVGRHFIARALPDTATRLARIRAGAENLMALPADAF